MTAVAPVASDQVGGGHPAVERRREVADGRQLGAVAVGGVAQAPRRVAGSTRTCAVRRRRRSAGGRARPGARRPGACRRSLSMVIAGDPLDRGGSPGRPWCPRAIAGELGVAARGEHRMMPSTCLDSARTRPASAAGVLVGVGDEDRVVATAGAGLHALDDARRRTGWPGRARPARWLPVRPVISPRAARLGW